MSTSAKKIKRGFNLAYNIAQARPDLIPLLNELGKGSSGFEVGLKAGVQYVELKRKIQHLRDTRSLISSKSKDHDRTR